LFGSLTDNRDGLGDAFGGDGSFVIEPWDGSAEDDAGVAREGFEVVDELECVWEELGMEFPIVRFGVIGAEFDDDDIWAKVVSFFSRWGFSPWVVAVVEHGSGTDTEVFDLVVLAEEPLQLGGVVIADSVFNAGAIGDGVSYACNLDWGGKGE